MKLLIGLILVMFLAVGLAFPRPTSAHLFGGPPFLSLNGRDAQTNPIYMSLPEITSPQDIAQGTFLVNQPIQLVVALDKLPVPEEVAKESTFRWHWDKGDSTVAYGSVQTHTYTTIGSHLVTLDVLAPGESDYLNLDTVRVQVLPSATYKLPAVTVKAVKDSFAVNKPISFITSVKTDPSATVKGYTWDFGDNTSSQQADPTHTYTGQTDFLDFAYVQVEDSHGFESEAGASVVADKGLIHLTALTATGSAIPLVDRRVTNSSKDSTAPLIAAAIAGCLIVIVGAVVIGVMVRQRKTSYV